MIKLKKFIAFAFAVVLFSSMLGGATYAFSISANINEYKTDYNSITKTSTNNYANVTVTRGAHYVNCIVETYVAKYFGSGSYSAEYKSDYGTIYYCNATNQLYYPDDHSAVDYMYEQFVPLVRIQKTSRFTSNTIDGSFIP
ncbi:MAG: hypothetical protein E7266_10015 [Lachnospiraceae bacterium]|nr:hypothetical protein [Lachnospiraceae bacterium]